MLFLCGSHFDSDILVLQSVGNVLPFLGLDESAVFSLVAQFCGPAEFVLSGKNCKTLWDQEVSGEAVFDFLYVTGACGRTYILQK